MSYAYRSPGFPLAIVAAMGVGLASASDQEQVESEELRTALSAAISQNRSLQAENSSLKQINKNLSSSLMAANAESEEFRKSYGEIRLQMEALGIEVVTGGTKGLEGKLLKAVNDIRLLDEEKMRISDALIAVSDAALRLIDSVGDISPDAVIPVKKAVADADVALGLESGKVNDPQFTAGALHHARVISAKKDYGVIVFNIGREAGVRIGMPFRIHRKDRPVGRTIVVDVRDNISAALVQTLTIADDVPRVGDIASVVTTQ
ncbi:MAG: hypothetical protein VCA55_00575 [Verrucomicrobiales bacterium]